MELLAASCFMCKNAGRDGCLECRFNRLARDIRTALYEKMGAEQHAAEWEDRGLVLESNNDNLRQLLFHAKQAQEQLRVGLHDSEGDVNRLVEVLYGIGEYIGAGNTKAAWDLALVTAKSHERKK